MVDILADPVSSISDYHEQILVLILFQFIFNQKFMQYYNVEL